MFERVYFLRVKCSRFPTSIISYAVWTYQCFALSTAKVEELLAKRGIDPGPDQQSTLQNYAQERCKIETSVNFNCIWTPLGGQARREIFLRRSKRKL
ncbi:transposase-like protein [Labrenzia sp. EL_142]|nr:transposase-like protein [Labrenzia sp. EL_142]